jgi:hypothetical protein
MQARNLFVVQYLGEESRSAPPTISELDLEYIASLISLNPPTNPSPETISRYNALLFSAQTFMGLHQSGFLHHWHLVYVGY